MELSKKQIALFLKDLTELTSKHGLIIGRDFKDLVPSEYIDLQFGFNLESKTYLAYNKLTLVTIEDSGEALNEAETVEFTEIDNKESEEA